MEDNKDFMSIFGDNPIELDFDTPINDGDQPNEDLDQDTNPDEDINDPIEEDVIPENVDEVEDDNESDESDSTDESSPNLYSSLVEALHEQGIIPSLESSKDVKSPEDLVDVFKKEIEIQSKAKLDEYIENLDVSKIVESKQTQLALDSITEDNIKENINLAKEIVYRDYLNQGLSEDRAKKLLKKTIDLGEEVLIEDAQESLESLKTFEKKRVETEKENYLRQVKEEQEQQKQLDLEIKNKIYNSKEIIKGIPTTKAQQERIYKTMTEIVGKNQDGVLENALMQDRSKNPVEFDIRMYAAYTLTNGFTDFSKVMKTTESKAISKLESAIRKTKIDDNGAPLYVQDSQSYSGFGSELVL